MQYFASSSLSELGTVLGIVFTAFGAILVGFYKYANSREKDFEKSRNNQTAAFDKTIEKLITSLNANVAAHNKVAEAVTKQASEPEKRNGHLAELQLQSQETMQLIADQATDKILNVVQEIGKQNVKEQNVEHLHVKNKE